MLLSTLDGVEFAFSAFTSWFSIPVAARHNRLGAFDLPLAVPMFSYLPEGNTRLG